MSAPAQKQAAYVAPPPRATSLEREEAACVLRRYRERLRLRVAVAAGRRREPGEEG